MDHTAVNAFLFQRLMTRRQRLDGVHHLNQHITSEEDLAEAARKLQALTGIISGTVAKNRAFP